MVGFNERLKKLNKAYKTTEPAKERGSGGGNPPDGTYYVKVERAALEETKREPKYIVSKWMLGIIQGEQKGRKLFTTYNIGHPEYGEMNMQFLKRDLAIMGIDSSDLLNAHEEALDCVLEVRAYTKPGSKWQNVYINNIIDAPGEESDESEEEEEEEVPAAPPKKAKKKARKAPKVKPTPQAEDDAPDPGVELAELDDDDFDFDM